MNVFKKRRRSVWLLTLLFTLVTGFANAVDIMPPSDVREGMRGVAKTVVQGDTIEEFDVNVLGVLQQRGPSGDLILVKVSGPVIEKTGGIAQGMSGSPVYIDGKLVGAIGYGWGFADGTVGMVTPIGDMLKLWALPDKAAHDEAPSVEPPLIPMGTPLMAAGFTPESLQYLTQKLAPFGLQPQATAGAGNYDAAPHALQPGSAVAVTLVTGDLKLGAIGTVTYADENRIVAFGHPFLKRGELDYFMHNSYIFTVVPSVNSAFKIGSIGSEIGKIYQDRGAGIAGIEGRAPKAVAMQVNVTDRDTQTDRAANVRMVEDHDLTPILAATTAYDLVKKTIDRGGRGTVKLSYEFLPQDTSLPTFKRDNMYYSAKSVSERSVDELYNVLEALAKNPFQKYALRGINLSLSLTEDKEVAEIIDAKARPGIVSPGDIIYVNVKLRPYRGEVVSKTLAFTVPADQPLGPMTLEVRGGGVVPLPYLIQKQQLNLTDEIIDRLRKYKDFRDFLKKLQNEDKNNELIVEILEDNVSMVPDEKSAGHHAQLQEPAKETLPDYLHKGKKTDADTLAGGDEDEKAKTRVTMPYIIKGDGQFEFEVVAPNDRRRRDAVKEIMAQLREKVTENDAEADNDQENKDANKEPQADKRPAKDKK